MTRLALVALLSTACSGGNAALLVTEPLPNDAGPDVAMLDAGATPEAGDEPTSAEDAGSPDEASVEAAATDAGTPADAGSDVPLPPVRCQLLYSNVVDVCGQGVASEITWRNPDGTAGACSIDPTRNGYCAPGTECCVVDLNQPSGCDLGTCL